MSQSGISNQWRSITSAVLQKIAAPPIFTNNVTYFCYIIDNIQQNQFLFNSFFIVIHYRISLMSIVIPQFMKKLQNPLNRIVRFTVPAYTCVYACAHVQDKKLIASSVAHTVLTLLCKCKIVFLFDSACVVLKNHVPYILPLSQPYC